MRFHGPKQFVAVSCLSLPLSALAADNDSNTVETILVEGRQYKLELEKERDQNPGGVTLIDSDDLYERNVTTMADMLRYVPGLWVASGSTGDSTFFSSRGSNLDATNYDGNGIKLLQDGLPITAADGNNHNRNIDPLSTRYAVIARGANALTYGASTLGGAINVISPTARDTKSQVYLNGGSHGQLQGRVTAGAVTGDVDGLITLEAKQWDGFREHQQQNRESLYANAGWKLSDALQTRFYLTYVDNNQELPGALTRAQFDEDPYQAQPAAQVGHYQYDVESWRAANKTIWDLSENASLTVGFSYEEQALYHPIVYSPFFSLLIDTDQNNFGSSVRYNLRTGDHDLLLGLDYGQTTVKGGNYSHEAGHRQDLMTRVDNEADSLELFVVDRWQLSPSWKLVYGVQGVLANREVRNTTVMNGALYNPTADYDSINPRVGAIYQLTENTELFANLSSLYEPPTNYELEDDTNPDDKALKAMQGEVLELGSRGDASLGADNRLYWELAVYYGQLDDEILSVDDPNAPGTSLSANVDSTIHAGVEALLGASFALGDSGEHRLEPLVNITLNEFSFDDDPIYGNNDLPVAPGYAIKAELIYRHASGFFAGPTVDLIDDRYADFSNTYSVDGYTLLGLRAGFRGQSWEVYADARNLTDEEYVSLFSVRNAASINDGILQAGEPRSFYAGVKIEF
ncbi:TonB-dependent receptor family protein [Gilvimarinus algae]|uniref:TonB-dependent receptor n=1 Tax=Gilvimarinus algae TaxID=3058037 RepID=A0ABT8TK16_9GAMM|nr:TonB-dependent receptor [Gilvimarinus sp. SDUM040014]MDO3383829.1 TonB-dependent receptor [Gilvimarinus sp. SDUM040014]